jgi:hypothetical protein
VQIPVAVEASSPTGCTSSPEEDWGASSFAEELEELEEPEEELEEEFEDLPEEPEKDSEG